MLTVVGRKRDVGLIRLSRPATQPAIGMTSKDVEAGAAMVTGSHNPPDYNGFKMMIQDTSGAGYRALEGATFAMMGAAAQAPDQVQQVFSTYNTGSPRISDDIDRDRALWMGIQQNEIEARPPQNRDVKT